MTETAETTAEETTEETAPTITVLDVAARLLLLDDRARVTRTPAMRLHHLCYLIYGEAITQNKEEPLFVSEVQAWPQGPIFPELNAHHKGKQLLSAADLPAAQLTKIELTPIEVVYIAYGAVTPGKLAEILRYEPAYSNARIDDNGQPLGPDEQYRNVMSTETIIESFAP